jgi:hypothetical protein
MTDGSRYAQIIEHVFLARYSEGDTEVAFERDDLLEAADELGVARPKNIGDLVYSFRYRRALPEAVQARAPEDKYWIIRPAGAARYRFVAVAEPRILPNELIRPIKVPDATPSIIAMYALSDEQALLAVLRYNRLIDVFTGVTCYSLQSHLRTTVTELGQIETDEVYLGVDRRGAHYAFPVQAKGGRDMLSIVQIEQDFAMCNDKFPDAICHGIGAQFMSEDVIALFEFEESEEGISLRQEKHYRLVAGDEISGSDLTLYGQS